MAPITIESSGGYLAYEFDMLERRLNARVAVRQDELEAAAYYALVEDLDQEREALVAARARAVDSGVAIPFHQIATRFGLTAVEETALLVALTPHLCASVWDLVLFAQGSVYKPYLEVGFVAELIAPSSDRLTDRSWCDPGGRLIREGLLEIEPPSGEPSVPVGALSYRAHAPHYVASYVTEGEVVDERLISFCELVGPAVDVADVILSDRAQARVQDFLRAFYRRGTAVDLKQRAWTLMISGAPGCGKTMLAEGLAKALGRQLFVVHFDRLTELRDGPSKVRLAAHNAGFLDAILLMSKPETLFSAGVERGAVSFGDPIRAAMIRCFSSYRGLVIVEPQYADRMGGEFERLLQFAIEIGLPDATAREFLWESLLPVDVELDETVHLGELASAYELTGGQIKLAINWAVQQATRWGECAKLKQKGLQLAAQTQLRSKLGRFTEAISAHLDLSALVLPKQTMSRVRELLTACRTRHRVMNEWGFARRLATGRGLVALFTGEPGTGKTLCAQILANELDRQLYQVSIPKVVSKWVGETEKNIRDVFSHARAQNSVLLFDEADSLFTTRVKVERAQDHYQNMEVNVLLQEIEAFDGIVLLTTNLSGSIDRAFDRRILFKIEFPNPDEVARERLWQVLIPDEAPVEAGVDFRLLGKAYNLTGGQIKNAVLRASFRCASADQPLTELALEEAAHEESRAAGRLTGSIDAVRTELESIKKD